MSELTEKQRRVFEYVRDTITTRQTPPTRAEIARALGFASANAAQAHLRTLERKGVLELNAHSSRGIRIAPSGMADARDDAAQPLLAVIGRVAAGAPMLAIENVERHCHVDPSLFGVTPDYLLRVTGDSMTGAGILDGDLLAVRTGTEVRSGQIAVFRWDDEVTVKRFQRDGHRARLVAENPNYADILVDTQREPPILEGLAVGVVRMI